MSLLCLFLLQKIDAQKLFNLFSNYGNIVHVKILHNKLDHAPIQMGDSSIQAELAFKYLKVWTNMNYFLLPVKSIVAGLGMLHMFSLVSWCIQNWIIVFMVRMFWQMVATEVKPLCTKFFGGFWKVFIAAHWCSLNARV